MKSFIAHMITSLLLLIFLTGCSSQQSQIDQIYELAGDNRAELERVLAVSSPAAIAGDGEQVACDQPSHCFAAASPYIIAAAKRSFGTTA